MTGKHSRRRLFTSYVKLEAVSALKAQLDAAGLHVPERVDGAGRRCGGKPFSRGHLYKILSNPIYVGRLSHKGKTYDGQQPAIVDGATWDSRAGPTRVARSSPDEAPARLRASPDPAGSRMTVVTP